MKPASPAIEVALDALERFSDAPACAVRLMESRPGLVRLILNLHVFNPAVRTSADWLVDGASRISIRIIRSEDAQLQSVI